MSVSDKLRGEMRSLEICALKRIEPQHLKSNTHDQRPASKRWIKYSIGDLRAL